MLVGLTFTRELYAKITGSHGCSGFTTTPILVGRCTCSVSPGESDAVQWSSYSKWSAVPTMRGGAADIAVAAGMVAIIIRATNGSAMCETAQQGSAAAD